MIPASPSPLLLPTSDGAAAVWDSSHKNAAVSLTLFDTTATGPGGGGASYHMGVRATVGKSSGKRFYECGPTYVGLTQYACIGIARVDMDISNNVLLGAVDGYGYFNNNGYLYPDGGTPVLLGATWNNTDRMGVLTNFDDNLLIFWKNGVPQGSPIAIPDGVTFYPACSVYGLSNRQGVTAIFVDGQDDIYWDYPPPVGYSGWAG